MASIKSASCTLCFRRSDYTLTAYDSSELGNVTVTLQAGDTLRSVAQRVYGNSNLWYVLAEANATTDEQLSAGTRLRVPEVKVSSNDATTFKPFNAAETIGDTAPSLPYIAPPPRHHCNALAVVLMAVVATVVTVFTAGVAAGASYGSIMATGTTALMGGTITVVGAAGATTVLGTASVMGAAALGGLAGSIASQEAGKALGVVDHFSLRSAVAGGLSAGITAGLGSKFDLSKIAEGARYAKVAQSAVSQAIGNGVSYAGNKLAGIDTAFSWKSIASSAVTGALTAVVVKPFGVDPKTKLGPVSEQGFANDLINGLAAGAVGTHVRRAFGFDDRIDYGNVAADAFGNALGNAAVRGIQTYSANKTLNAGTRKVLDAAGIAYTLDKHGRPVTESQALLRTVQGLLSAGNSTEDIVSVVSDGSMQNLFGRSDSITEHLNESAELAGREHIHDGPAILFPLREEASLIATAIDGSNISSIQSQRAPDGFIVNAVNNVLTPIADAAADVYEFAEAHPTSTKLVTLSVQAAQIALLGPLVFVKDKVIDGIVGPYIEQGSAALADFYQSKGVRQGASLLAAAGTLFAGALIVGKVRQSLQEARHAAELRSLKEVVGRETENVADKDGPANRVLHERYKAELRAAMEKPTVSDKMLSGLVDKLYRPNAKVGSGSTAAAVREELITRKPVGNGFHSQKAQDSILALQKWLDGNPTARPGDRAAAENIIRDMDDALRGH